MSVQEQQLPLFGCTVLFTTKHGNVIGYVSKLLDLLLEFFAPRGSDGKVEGSQFRDSLGLEELKNKLGSFSYFALDVNVTAVIFDSAPHHRHA